MEENGFLCLKKQINQIIDRIDRLLSLNALNMQHNYVRAFPKIIERRAELSMPFLNRELNFFRDSNKIASDITFRVGYIEATKIFLDFMGKDIDNGCDDSALISGIARFTANGGTEHIYILRVDADEFMPLYSKDQDYFDYINSNEQPFDGDLQLTFNYLRNVRDDDRTIILVIDDAFRYTGIDFSGQGKKYISKKITVTAERMGSNIKSGNIDVLPYDYYFSSLDSKLAVTYFLSQMKSAIERQTVTLNDVGKLLEYNASEVISYVAFASNNFVGTRYDSRGVHEIEQYYLSLPKPQGKIDAPYLNPAFVKMFAELSIKASENLVKLEDPRLFKPLLTAEWMFNNIGDVEGFDNTFIGFGYLKLVEALMAKILVEDYNGCEMSISSSRSITISMGTEEQMMLGSMIRFATKNTSSELHKSRFCWQITDALYDWKDEIRNGYFHKHTLNRKDVELIRNRTFEVIYMILGTLPR